MKYRSEIDGLRAIAVIPVILFHAGIQTFQGGFIGVDVFFVISGYLITTIMLLDVKSGSFSILNFYERRARRILPALFLVMFVSLPFAWFWLSPGDMVDYSKSLTAVSTFTANSYFWRHSGYFDTATEFAPLVHTWSLAVEEQFYLFFPLLFVLLWRIRAAAVLSAVSVIFVLSLLGAQWGTNNGHSGFTFYMLPTRAWELALGALVALYYLERNIKHHKHWLSQWGSLLGLLLIVYSAITYSKETPFPGLYTLAPTVGAMLIIIFATHLTWVGKLLGSKFLVATGLVSYSAYLWHQPIFAFSRHVGLQEPDIVLMLFLSVLSFVLAYLSWRFVERPFRNKRKFTRRQVFAFGGIGTIFFIVLGSIGVAQNGFKKTELHVWPKITPGLNDSFIILGDSHAKHLVKGIRSITKGSVTDYSSGGCLPLRNVDRYDSRTPPGDCVNKVNAALDKLINEDPHAFVLLGSMGPVYLDGTTFKGKGKPRIRGLGVELVTDKSISDRWQIFEFGLNATLSELTSLKHVRVIVVIDVPELGIDFGCGGGGKEISIGSFKLHDFTTASTTLPARCSVSRYEYDKRSRNYKNLVYRVVSKYPNVIVFDPTNYFCDSDKCSGFSSEYGYLYRDYDHLSEGGSRYFGEKFYKFLKDYDITAQ